ncbi:hypothetical protein Tco_1503683 [Tanacetum coccineum]
MNPYFAMNPTDDEEERQPNAFDVDDESDVYFLQQVYEYHETLVADENRLVLTRNPIYRDRERAEDRLMDDYFDDPCANNDINILESARKDIELAFGVLQRPDQKMAVTDWNEVYANPSRNMQRTLVERCETHCRKAKELWDRDTHISLQHNLMEHIWHEVEHEDEDEDF